MSKVDLLRQIQADSLVFFIKVHNYHWNVKGGDFHHIHKVTEGIYETFKEIFDDVAERILQLKELPVITISDALKISKVKEDTRTSFNSRAVLESILKDYVYFLDAYRALLSASGDDVATSDYAGSQIAHLEKAIWMLEAQVS